MKRTMWVMVGLVSSLAMGQTTVEKTSKPPPKVQNLTFGDGDVIDGVTQHPDGEVLLSYGRKHFDNLIKVRVDFNDKLRQSVHEL